MRWDCRLYSYIYNAYSYREYNFTKTARTASHILIQSDLAVTGLLCRTRSPANLVLLERTNLSFGRHVITETLLYGSVRARSDCRL